ncbi:MAG: serine/threonine-protein kinase, partial [Candidatus Sericytochromatia bacterium]
DATIEKALRFDPAQRYSTMSAFRQRLEDWQTGTEPEDSERYTQRRLVKRTRNSLVFQAFDTKLQRQVGLKKLLLDPRLTDAERQPQLKQLLREAQLASSLVHPHIISVFDHFIEDGDGYIVMEWLEGKNLRELLDAKTQLTFEQIKSIAQQVGEALQYAHSQGVVHRDIKPENIIYHQGQATVLDFGIAHTTDRAQTADIQKTAGTARYMAPEVLAGSEIDVRADIFSLGVVLYELITCQYPYEASVIMARYNPQLLQPVEPASGQNIDCPPEVDAVLAKALQVDPELRHPTVAEFVSAFLSLEDRRPVRHRPKPAAGGWPLLIGVSAITFLLFVAVGVYASRSYKTMFADTPAPAPSALAPEAAATQAALPVATPAPEATPTPRPARPSWVSAPITIDGVTVQVEKVGLADGRTIVTLRVDNRSGEAIAFLTRNDRPDLFKLRDDLGRDYTQSLDLVSVDPQLLRIEAGTQVTGAFSLLEEINVDASALDLVLKEYEGVGRKFPLKSLKLVQSR